MAAKKKTTRKKKGKISFAEFKAWLKGVQSMQDEDWTPTTTQWQTIQAEIDSIDISLDGVEPKKAKTAAPVHSPSRFDNAPPTFPQVPSSIPDDVIVDSTMDTTIQTPRAPAPRAPAAPAPSGLPVNPDGSTQTPNIDTSDGTYKSPFT